MPKSSGIQVGTVTQEGYNTSAIRLSHGTNRDATLAHAQLGMLKLCPNPV